MLLSGTLCNYFDLHGITENHRSRKKYSMCYICKLKEFLTGGKSISWDNNIMPDKVIFGWLLFSSKQCKIYNHLFVFAMKQRGTAVSSGHCKLCYRETEYKM